MIKTIPMYTLKAKVNFMVRDLLCIHHPTQDASRHQNNVGGYIRDTKKCETVTAWKVDRAFLKVLVEPFSPSEGPMRPFNLAHLGSASLLSGGPVPKKLERLATAFRKLQRILHGDGYEENHTWGKPKLNKYVALTWPLRPHDMSTQL